VLICNRSHARLVELAEIARFQRGTQIWRSVRKIP